MGRGCVSNALSDAFVNWYRRVCPDDQSIFLWGPPASGSSSSRPPSVADGVRSRACGYPAAATLMSLQCGVWNLAQSECYPRCRRIRKEKAASIFMANFSLGVDAAYRQTGDQFAFYESQFSECGGRFRSSCSRGTWRPTLTNP